METLQLWEEKNSTEPEMNCSNNNDSVPNDITINIETNSMLLQCENTGSEKQWKKNCPDCGKEQQYAHYSGILRAKKNNTPCPKCSHNKLEYTEKASLIRTGIPNLSRRKRPFESRFNHLLHNAKDRGIQCLITYEDYLTFTKINQCQYCKSPIQWNPYQGRRNGRNTASNLDRKNSNEGYTTSNCCVCCWHCNTVKSNIFSHEEMIELGKKIQQIKTNRTWKK